jgi:hypothetical protein
MGLDVLTNVFLFCFCFVFCFVCFRLFCLCSPIKWYLIGAETCLRTWVGTVGAGKGWRSWQRGEFDERGGCGEWTSCGELTSGRMW